MNRIGNSVQRAVESDHDESSTSSDLAELSGNELDERLNQVPVIDIQNDESLHQEDEAVLPIPLPPLPSYVLTMSSMLSEQKLNFPKIKMFGAYLGMDIETLPLEQTVSADLGGSWSRLKLMETSPSFYSIVPRRGARSTVMASYSVENGRIVSISAESGMWGLLDRTSGMSQDQLNEMIHKRYGIEFNLFGEADAAGPQVEIETTLITMSMPKSKGNDLITEENERVQGYFGIVRRTLAQSFLGLNLGESVESVMAKCEFKRLQPRVVDEVVAGDKYGIPNRRIIIEGNLATREVCDETVLLFMMDRLVRVNCNHLSPGIAESIRNKYGLQPNEYGQFKIKADGQSVSVSLDEQLGLTYTYDSLNQLGISYKNSLEESILKHNLKSRQKNTGVLDI